jgi:hypothetical protein
MRPEISRLMGVTPEKFNAFDNHGMEEPRGLVDRCQALMTIELSQRDSDRDFARLTQSVFGQIVAAA